MNKTCIYLLIIVLIINLILIIDYLKIRSELKVLQERQENIVCNPESSGSVNQPEPVAGNPQDFRELMAKFLEEQNDQLHSHPESYLATRFIPDLMPLSAEAVVSQSFSGKHPGLDLAAPTGTEVKAAAAGKVKVYNDDDYFGNLIVIEHFNGYYTYYAHLQKIIAAPGSFAEKGDIIGTVGSTGFSTGPHLHYSIQKDGIFIDPVQYLR